MRNPFYACTRELGVNTKRRRDEKLESRSKSRSFRVMGSNESCRGSHLLRHVCPTINSHGLIGLNGSINNAHPGKRDCS